MTALFILFGSACVVVICWLAWRAGLLECGIVDRDEDGAASEREVANIVAATRPAPLDDEPRPHVRAGTAWGNS